MKSKSRRPVRERRLSLRYAQVVYSCAVLTAFLALFFVASAAASGAEEVALEQRTSRHIIVKSLVLGFTFLTIFIPMVLLPTLRKRLAESGKPNPFKANVQEWVAAAKKIETPLEKMDGDQLQITSTVVLLKVLSKIRADTRDGRADMRDAFTELKRIGWTVVAIFATLAANQIVFVP